MELKDYQSILGEQAAQVEKIFAKYPDVAPNLVKNFSEINAKKIRSVEPEIMVYGIYNAGKSSILNELMGEDRAKTDEVPTTDSVDYYDWQGYKIADTPGVFAPIEHEEVTEEHLKKADIVLFVMSTTGSNERIENYKRMKDIADAGKKIIIVLNDKNSDMGRNEENIQLIKSQVAVNMEKVGIDSVDKKYCIVTVNAARARKGRLEHKAGLIAKSGIEELQEVIISELKRTTSFDVLRQGIKQIENILENFIVALEGSENSELIRKMNHVLQEFNKQKISIRQRLNTYIDTQAESLGNNLPQLIWDSRNTHEDVNSIVGKEIEYLNEKIQREMKNHLTDAATILELELKSFTEIKIDSHSIDADSLKNVLTQLSSVTAQTTADSTALTTQESNVPKVDFSGVGLAAGLLTESGAAIASNIAKTAVGKAIASTALGKIAGSVLPIVGPIITIFSVLDALFGGKSDKEKIDEQIKQQNEQERRRVEAEKQARQELNQKCHYLADKIADEFKSATNNGIMETLQKYEEPFKVELQRRQAEGEALGNDIVKLRELNDEYYRLNVELGAR